MLAATRARPAATLLPHSARQRLAASFATQCRRAFAHDPLPAPGNRRRRGLAGVLRGERAACSANLLAAVPPDPRRDAGCPEPRGELLDDGTGRGLPARERD